MNGFSHNFKKYIYLPSGGLSYPPNCWVSIVTNELMLLHANNSFSNTNFEYMCQIVKKYSILPIEIEELYLQDFYYIWFMIFSLFITGKTYEVNTLICNYCNANQKINIDYTKLIIRQNEYKSIPKKIFEIKEYKIQFGLRKVKHNLEFPYKSLNKINYYIIKIVLFLSQQVEQITIKDKQINSDFFYEIISSLSIKDLFVIYTDIIEYNKLFGIYDMFEFYCKNKECKKVNNFQLFNDFALCTFKLGGNISSSEITQFFKRTLGLLQLKIIDSEDYYSIPYINSEEFFTAFNQLDFSLMMPRLW